jgi:hypothetical protein
VFVVKPSNRRVTAGERVEIPVVVNAQPDAEIFWLTPGGPAEMLQGFQVFTSWKTIFNFIDSMFSQYSYANLLAIFIFCDLGAFFPL